MVSEHKLGKSLGVATYYNIACPGYDRTPQPMSHTFYEMINNQCQSETLKSYRYSITV